jgi:hypothetical protein
LNSSFCPHLMLARKQASATIDGTRYCAACACEVVERMLSELYTPTAIAEALQFDDRASRVGVTGGLLLLWSWGKLSDDPAQRWTANRVGSIVKALRRLHGDLFYMGDNPKQQAA